MRKRSSGPSTEQPRSYISELRAYREDGFAQLLAQDGYTASSFEKAFGSEAFEKFKRDYTSQFMMIQNQTRGKLGELWGEILLTSQLRAEKKDVERDSSVFSTPFGRRRVDVFWTNHLLALEVKSGRVILSKSIKMQIDKDKYLLEHGILSTVIWVLLQGASWRSREALQKAGISVVDGYEGGMPPALRLL